MKVFQSVLLATVLCFFESGSAYVLSTKDKWEGHNNVIKEEKFFCRNPQRRAISAREIMQDENKELQNAMIYPTETILYRCESSGCCKGNKTCTAYEDEEVPLTFLVVYGSTAQHVEVIATNHTSCTCQKSQKSNIK